ncbi:hypothetical protein RchiOBHm_Chr1g0365601 [Rosa chinensis]|uniref:Uncharacterized protein n=1 Tax=Rosa chinensis TaxID=74649 RepID=A0A2P6SK19_ROSCH|nr:hypothetical protein RchiOBHm_Chr1g0365601 [Rosa chinensis]
MLCFHHYLIFYIFYKPLSYSTFIIFLHLIISLFFFLPINTLLLSLSNHLPSSISSSLSLHFLSIFSPSSSAFNVSSKGEEEEEGAVSIIIHPPP